MKREILFLFFVIISFALAGCAGTTSQMDAAPTLEIINLQITPELQHWLPVIADCAGDLPGFGLTTEISPESALSLDSSDMIIRLGFQSESDPFVSVLGAEPIAVIIGAQVPLTAISLDSLRGIFSGKFTNWNNLPETKSLDIELDQPIISLSYPEGSSIRQLFEITHLQSEPIGVTSIQFLLPTTTSKLLKDNPYAIGYLLESQVPEGKNTLIISDFETEQVAPYVLSITRVEPEGNLRQLLLCVQNQIPAQEKIQ